LARAITQRRTMSAADNPTPQTADKSDSFVFGIFNGRINKSHIFPYPNVFDQESFEETEAFYDAADAAFSDVNTALDNDLTETIKPDQIEAAKEFGMLGMQVPEEYEGLALNNTQFARLSEIGGKYDLASSILMGAHQSIGFKAILIQGTKDQKDRYLADVASGRKIAAFALTEPTMGSDASAVKTKAELQPDGSFIINGSKIWISNGGIAEIFTVFAQVPMKQDDGTTKNKMAAFIVERAFGGVTNGPPEKKMGIKASNTTEVFFDNVPVPADNLIGEIGEGFKVAMNVLNSGRFGMGAVLNGTQKQLIKRAVDFAKNRKQFGDYIYKFGAIQEKLARMNAEQYAAESVAYLVAMSMDNQAENFHLEAACSKIFASECAWRTADETIQTMGGMGYMFEQGVEKVMRDLRIFRIFEGTNDILRLMIGLSALQSVGDELQPVVTAAKNVKNKTQLASSVKTLATYAYDQKMKSLEKRSNAIEDLKSVVDDRLRDEAEALGRAITRLEVISKKLLQKFNKKIIHQQFHVKRVADAALDIYASAATMSRATKVQGTANPDKDAEIVLARIFLHESLRRINNALDELERSADEEHWQRMEDITNRLVENDGVLGVHPISLIK